MGRLARVLGAQCFEQLDEFRTAGGGDGDVEMTDGVGGAPLIDEGDEIAVGSDEVGLQPDGETEVLLASATWPLRARMEPRSVWAWAAWSSRMG